MGQLSCRVLRINNKAEKYMASNSMAFIAIEIQQCIADTNFQDLVFLYFI
jgi:hypothetical protein